MNLNDLPISRGTRKVNGGALVEKYMQYDLIKSRVLRVSMVFPIRDVHIPLDIPFECFLSVDADSRMNEIGAGFAVPESELDDFNKGAGSSLESSSVRLPPSILDSLGKNFPSSPK